MNAPAGVTVRDVTGDWTVETSSAWIWVYDWMAAHMLGEA